MTDTAHVIARNSLALEPLAQNVRRARRTVVETLESADRHDLADNAALATSEIVTNAVLHAGSDIWLTVTVTADGALVEVEDHSRALPQVRSYDATATTGRGLSLVDQLVTAFGVRRIPGDGKVVWFTLGDAVPPTGAAVSRDAHRAASVRLLRVPVALYCTFQQVADGLLREYLLALSAGDASPAELLDWNLANEAFAELATGGSAAFATRDSDVVNLDLSLELGPRGAERFASMRRVLDRAVAMAAAGRLLAPPSQPEIVGLSNWCCEQVVAQLHGKEAAPWRPGRGARVPHSTPVEWDAADVNGSDRAIVAADDANRLIAVSHAAA
ncbi:MAG: ATP-binding protein, partial [Mycobacteriales bacterium]